MMTSLIDFLVERYQRALLIVTSQVEPQGWLKLFEDTVIAEAIVDRLIHPSQKITLKGECSYREKIKEKKGLKKQRKINVKQLSSRRSDPGGSLN